MSELGRHEWGERGSASPLVSNNHGCDGPCRHEPRRFIFLKSGFRGVALCMNSGHAGRISRIVITLLIVAITLANIAFTGSGLGVQLFPQSHRIMRSRALRAATWYDIVTAKDRERCLRAVESPNSFVLSGQTFKRAPLSPSAAEWVPKGLVMTGSGQIGRQAVGVYVTAYLVRKVHRSSLPIEVFFVSEEERFSDRLVAALEGLGGVRVRSLVEALDEMVAGYPAAEKQDYAYLRPSVGELTSYAAKPYAVLASSFRENILLDSGAVVFDDPADFLDLHSYKVSGFFGFRDYVPTSSFKWDFMPAEFCVDIFAMDRYLQGNEADSSCVLFDKLDNWDPLLVTCILNGPLQDITYAMLNGDKETWLLGMMHMGRKLEPATNSPGFIFLDYERNNTARKVHGQFLQTSRSSNQLLGSGDKRFGKKPLYFNNQLFNFSDWEAWRNRIYMGTADEFGGVYKQAYVGSLDLGPPDCEDFPISQLTPITSAVTTAFDGVAAALRSIGSRHCVCRDEWPRVCDPFAGHW